MAIENAVATVGAHASSDLCFNCDGSSNPGDSLNDASGICQNITRAEVSGAAYEVNAQEFPTAPALENAGTPVFNLLDTQP